MRIQGLVLAVAAAAVCCPSPALAAVRSGSVTDPIEGLVAPGRDMNGVSAAYDDSTGGLTATVRFAGPLSAETNAKVSAVFFSGTGEGHRCGGITRVAVLVGSTGDPSAHVESDLFKQPPPGFAVLPQAPAANRSVSDDGQSLTLSYTDGRFAGLDVTHVYADVSSGPSIFDYTKDCLWFEGFAPAAISDITDVTTAKSSVSEVVHVGQANSAVTVALIYKSKTVSRRTIVAPSGGEVPMTVTVSAAGRRLLKGTGTKSKRRVTLSLVTTVAPAAGSPPPTTQRRSVSVTF
jgi:hypothetical protein